MSTEELKPAAINGILFTENGEYQFDRTDLKSRPVAVNFRNTGVESVDIKIGGLTFRLTSQQERTFSVPYGYYLKGGADISFVGGRSSTTRLTITTIDAL